MLLVPLLENNTSDIELVKKNRIKKNFILQNVKVIPANEHSLQEDGSSSRDYICYYGTKFFESLSMFLFLRKFFGHAYFIYIYIYIYTYKAYTYMCIDICTQIYIEREI